MVKRIVILIVAGVCLGASAPARADVSGDFCGDIESIAQGWRNVFPLGDAASCPELCRQWVQSCNGVVRAAKRCTLAVAEQLAIVQSAQCATEATAPARAQCHRTSRAETDALKAWTEVQAEMGLAFCADPQQTDDCLATCQTPE